MITDRPMLNKILKDAKAEKETMTGTLSTETNEPQEVAPGVIAGGRMGGLLEVKPVPNKAQLLVKLPEVLREEIKAAAKKEGISTNQWVLNLFIEKIRPQKENA